MKDLTVLTTTFNRAQLLKKCYESLKVQTCKNFEWVIIDDGSNDDTRSVVSEFSEQDCGFPIKYYFKENGGKHTALNFSHEVIGGEYTIILDSDDMLTQSAVEKILDKWKVYEERQDIWCLSFLRGRSENEPIAVYGCKEDIISNHIDFRIKKNIKGDCAEVVRSSVFKEYTFPEFKGEKFLGENYLWINASYNYKTVYVSEIIYICDYLEGGLTKSGRKMRLKNPHGGMLTANLYLKKGFSFKCRVKNAILFDVYARAAGHPVKLIKQANKRLLCYFCLPLGWLFYLKWSR